MDQTFRRRWLAPALLCGVLVVVPGSGTSLFAQGQGQGPGQPSTPTPLPSPKPVEPAPANPPAAANPGPCLPGPYAIPLGSNTYPGGVNSSTPAVLPFDAAPPLQGEHPLPINLATALRLANAQAWDIGIASQQIRVAAAQLTRANVLWLPTLAMGADYLHHDGILQSIPGSIQSTNKNALELGGAPELVFSFSEAIFEPLAQRQIVKARKADLQTATNDITFNVARAYFDVQQARGILAGVQDATKRTRELVRIIEKLAPELVPELEIARARAQLANFEASEQTSRENWNVASAELARIIRLDPAAVFIPVEPPHLQVTLVSPEQPIDNLLPVALAARPELVAYQALTQAALKRWREEQFRPALPNVYLRGANGQLPDSMMFGGFTGGPNGTFSSMRGRADYELQVMWELRNLGLGNVASMRERRAEYDVTRMQAYRLQDFVAREVVQAYALVRSARERVNRAEEELKQAEISARLNLEGVSQFKRPQANIILEVIRPQEAVVAMSALLQAYDHYYSSIADYNRYEFQLYRALGNPAQILASMSADNPNGCAPVNPNPAPPLPAGPGSHGHADQMAPQAPPVPGASAGPVSRSVPDVAPSAGVVQTAGAAKAACASVLVRVPKDAELFCDGVKMRLTGNERNFVTPPLPPGGAYPYELRMRWTGADGKPIEVSRQVQVTAGQQTTVDFFAKAK